MNNIFADIPSSIPEEIFRTILENPSVKIERIISRGQATPEGEWYDLDKSEWVLVLKGSAKILFEGEEELSLNTGDFINIPPHRRHRVTWTDHDTETI